MQEPTVASLLIAAVTGLAGVVVFLWKQINEGNKNREVQYVELQARHDECDDDRRKLWRALYSIHPAAKELREVDE